MSGFFEKIILLIVLTGITNCSFLPTAGWSSEYAGESISYEIRPIGVAEYNDLGKVGLRGRELNLVTFRTQVLGFDDREKIYSDPKTYLPIRVERDISMWAAKEYLTEDYKPQDSTLIIKKFKNHKQVNEYSYKENSPIHNAIILPFYLRRIAELKLGWSMDIRLPDKFTVKLVAIEKVKVPAGKFTAFHFTSIPNKFEIWITNDALRIPIKIKGAGGLGYTLMMKKRVILNLS